jgi:hypothetical protein
MGAGAAFAIRGIRGLTSFPPGDTIACVTRMHLTQLENYLWAIGTALKVFLCVLAWHRRLYRRLPFFFVYVVLLVAEVLVVWSAYRLWGYTSGVAWYTYWCAVGALLVTRGFVVAELCRASLRDYPAIWSLLRKGLGLIAVIVLAAASFAAYQSKIPIAAFIVTAERGLEISILVILVAMIGLAVRYDIAPAPLERDIILGLAVYSTFQVLNDSFINQWMAPHFLWWNSTRILAFDAALLLWIFALRKPIPPTDRPVLLSADGSQHLLGGLLARMRAAIEELKHPGNPRRK